MVYTLHIHPVYTLHIHPVYTLHIHPVLTLGRGTPLRRVTYKPYLGRHIYTFLPFHPFNRGFDGVVACF